MPLPLATADRFAAKIVAELAPFCDQLEIAGSIRRRRPFVNDIDLVVVPKPDREVALRERCKRNAVKVQTDGETSLVIVLPYPPAGADGLQLDIWIARPTVTDLLMTKPTNFGTLLLCRTGSSRHNIYLLEHAKRLGLRWNTYHGIFDGRGHCLASATEEEIFQALKLPFVAPERREV